LKSTASALAMLFIRRLVLAALFLTTVIATTYLGLGMANGIPFQDAFTRSVEKTIAYLSHLLQGDLGMSSAGSITMLPVRVAEVAPEIILRSFGLLGVSLLFAALVGALVGILASLQRRSAFSLFMLSATLLGISVPSFFLALLLQIGVLKLTAHLGYSILPVGGFGWDKRLILPALVLAARPLAQIARVGYITTGQVLKEDFVRTAYSKGLRQGRTLVVHVLRNSAIPILTTIAVSLRFSLCSLPVVEYFFGWPGVGFTLLKSIARRDDDLTIFLLLSLGLLIILLNLLVDFSYRLIDPRLQQEGLAGAGDRKLKAAEGMREFFGYLGRSFRNSWLAGLFIKRPSQHSPNPFQALARHRDAQNGLEDDTLQTSELRYWIKGTVGNLPLVIGTILLSLLLVVLFYGPSLAPHSPYTTVGMTYEDGQFTIPPFPPDETYPWGTDVLGRDMLSLILSGAQQTLLLAGMAMLARLLVGVVLGAAAGWFKDSWLDRAILTLAEVIATFPTLLLAMTLILAIGIRQGMRPFIIALSLVGWGEIMQFVRSEVISLRPRLFIESAYALGVPGPRIIRKHILPNLVPALVSLAAIEMGAVLMLLGELGFISIFIGGGAFVELFIWGPAYHYSEVPEWGALLSNTRTYARSYPWMAIYPSLAFFVSILGFNFFGEGLRRLMDIVGVKIARIANRYTLLATVGAAVLLFLTRGSTGTLPFFEQQAFAFNRENAMASLEDLVSPTFEGRALGSAGFEASGDYIANQFAAYGLQSGGEQMSFFQTRSRDYVTLSEIPQMVIEDGGPALVYHRDFVEYPSFYTSLGQEQGRVRVFSCGVLSVVGQWSQYIPALRELSYENDILMVFDEENLNTAQKLPRAGILFVTDDATLLRQRYTLSPLLNRASIWGGYTQKTSIFPELMISESVAEHILEPSGLSVRQLRRQVDELKQDEVLDLLLDTTVSLSLSGEIHQGSKARHVIGHLPGVSATGPTRIDNQLVMVLAQYDCPPIGPDGLQYPCANDNASGVAVMLEAIRLMQETGYQPKRTFLFVAFSGEGFEGGHRVVPDPAKLLQTRVGFDTNYKVEAIIDLRGLGAQGKDGLVYTTGGSQRLAKLLESAARHADVPIKRLFESVDISVVFEDQSRGQDAPYVNIYWDGWQESSRLPQDTLENISPQNIEQAGKALTLALMILGHELNY
jgi:peptide/nickel transport system permease protein